MAHGERDSFSKAGLRLGRCVFLSRLAKWLRRERWPRRGLAGGRYGTPLRGPRRREAFEAFSFGIVLPSFVIL